MIRRSKDLEGKTYINGKNKSIYSNVFKNHYKKIIDDYIDRKIEEKDILDKRNKVNKGVEIYNANKNLYKNSLNIEDQIINSKKYAEGLKKIIRLIDSNKIRIGKGFVEASTIAMPWIDDWELYKQINEDVFAKYRKDKDFLELLSIKTFLDNINSGITKNKKDAQKEFKTIKKIVQSESLKYIVKELEKSIFGNDDSNGESSKDSEKRTFAPSSLPKKDYSAETDEYLKYMEEQEKGQKRFSDDYDSNEWSSGSGLKILTNKQMLNRLPVLLAQIQAGNNSIKLKNEIRQILCSLYRSKVLTKAVYNNLIKSIR